MALKIKPQHYRHILGQFKTLTIKEVRDEVKHAKSLNVAPALANKRVRHNLMKRRISSSWIAENLYPYMNDSHLDSALKKIVKEVEIPQIWEYDLSQQSV